MGRSDGTKRVDASVCLARRQDGVRAWQTLSVPKGGSLYPHEDPGILYWPLYHVPYASAAAAAAALGSHCEEGKLLCVLTDHSDLAMQDKAKRACRFQPPSHGEAAGASAAWDYFLQCCYRAV
jgi:hypothetical protein